MSEHNGEVYQSKEKRNECKVIWRNILNVMGHVGFSVEVGNR